jgi:hypothetical protein
MQTGGFEEPQAVYGSDTAASLIGQIRRFGDEGPAYEVLRLVDTTSAWIGVICSDEELAYPIAHIIADPIAETIP